jgi:hypothetical protein
MGPGHLPGDGYVAVFDLPFGEKTCSENQSSTGSAAQMEVYGSRTASEGYVRLRALGLPQGLAGLFLGSKAAGFVPSPGGSQGNLCLGGPIARFSQGGQYGTPMPDGSFELSRDTGHFQFWYRFRNAGQTTNFSSAIEVAFE